MLINEFYKKKFESMFWLIKDEKFCFCYLHVDMYMYVYWMIFIGQYIFLYDILWLI